MWQVSKRGILKAALLAALPVEIVNFWLVGHPGGSEGWASSSQSSVLAVEWYLLHAPGVVASNWSGYLRTHAAACSVMFCIVGYLDTAIVLGGILWILRTAIRRLRKRR